MNRRKFIQTTSVAGATVILGTTVGCSKSSNSFQNGISPWPICLNTSTIRKERLKDKISVAVENGYDGIELWINDLEKYEDEGGNISELGDEIIAKGLFVPNIIGLWDCMPMDDSDFSNSLPATKNRMRISSEVGSEFVAAIPVPDRADFDPMIGMNRYKELLKIGREEYGIKVAFEFVGFFKGIHRFGQAAGTAIDVNDPDASLVMDTFHLFRGNSGFNGIKHISGDFIANFHINDVPSSPPREEQGDEHRIYPGDGILPLVKLFKDLKTINYQRALSLEMFNRGQWKLDPNEVAETALRKVVKLIKKAEVL